MNKYMFLIPAGIFLAALCTAPVQAEIMYSANCRISSTVVSGGGAPIDSTGFSVDATFGQSSPLITSGTPLQSASVRLVSGFRHTLLDLTDSDGDGISDIIEDLDQDGIVDAGETDPDDADTDDDGLSDGEEDSNYNGIVDALETDPRETDTDGDGLQDGTEVGEYTGTVDTDMGVFIPDADTSSRTDPLDEDTDNDGIWDGEEDANHNGAVDAEETDPNDSNRKAMPWIMLLLDD